MTTIRDALDRTLLLMRDELRDDATDDQLLSALTETEVAIVADAETLRLPSAQTTFITLAMLAARSGHRVRLLAPDVGLVGLQPPFRESGVVSALLEANGDLLPIDQFTTKTPTRPADLCVLVGKSTGCEALKTLAMSASPWGAQCSTSAPTPPWSTSPWPFGALAGSAILAGEAFKAAMHRLKSSARNPEFFESLFRPINDLDFALAPSDTPTPTDLGNFDFISGGAITNAALYAVGRIPQVTGTARVIEPETADCSNLNRYALLRRSDIPKSKAPLLAHLNLGALTIKPIEERFDGSKNNSFGVFAPKVLVGVDHIPSRWNVQKKKPAWLGIGATTHWSAMASFHSEGLPCAGCLHPTDDPDERQIPTVSFVSFMAGLMLATYFTRAVACDRISATAQQSYLTSLRPESLWQSSIAYNENCPVRVQSSACLA